MQFVYNIFRCDISPSTEALLGLSDDYRVSNDVFGGYQQMLNKYRFDNLIRDGKIILGNRWRAE
jgi:hypothetical protein